MLRLHLPHLTRLALRWHGFSWDFSHVVQLWPNLRELSLSGSARLQHEGEPAGRSIVATCMAQMDAHSFLSKTAQHAALATKAHFLPVSLEGVHVRSSMALRFFPLVPAAIENLTCLEALNMQHCPHVSIRAFQHLKTTCLKKLSFSDNFVVGPRLLGLHPHKQLTSLVLVESK